MRARLMREFALDRARPNAAHDSLARAARSPRVLGIATQNVDGLHAAAGTPADKLVELHGNAANVRCMECGLVEPYSAVAEVAARGAVTCAACGGVVKPDVVLFGEALPADALRRAEEWARASDAYVCIGSSLSVWPAAGLPVLAHERGARLVVVNEGPTDLDEVADVRIGGAVGVVVPALLAEAGLLP